MRTVDSRLCQRLFHGHDAHESSAAVDLTAVYTQQVTHLRIAQLYLTHRELVVRCGQITHLTNARKTIFQIFLALQLVGAYCRDYASTCYDYSLTHAFYFVRFSLT